ncbi:hypothetical protein [Streptomyces sp. LN699]|uniref:hypothetical protein n=1 Tax=Streptomyces sp. LN699 TaxID=3112981 RepID=UPI0037156644
MTTPTRSQTHPPRPPRPSRTPPATLTAAWRILTTAQNRLLDTLAAIRPGRSASARIRAAQLVFQRAVADFNRAVGAFTERWAATDLPLAYREGAFGMLDRADRPRRMWSWTARHQASITNLSSQYYADLMGRLQEAVRRAQAFLRAAVEAARARASRFEYGTFNRDTLREEHPLGTVIYANDARHPVEAWAAPPVTGEAVTTANAGAVTTAYEQLGTTQVQVRDGAGCGWSSHKDPDRADGTIQSIDDALAHPTAHAHCVRVFAALRTPHPRPRSRNMTTVLHRDSHGLHPGTVPRPQRKLVSIGMASADGRRFYAVNSDVPFELCLTQLPQGSHRRATDPA